MYGFRSAPASWRAALISLFLIAVGKAAAIDGKTRPAQCAGPWYPSDPTALTQRLDALLSGPNPPGLSGKPVALICPHAGYRFSAPVAAAAYRALRGHRYQRVIVLAFSHRFAAQYEGVDVPRALTAYATPLGHVPIDRKICDRLLEKPVFSAHPGVDRGEHSLELQLPFLQRVVKTFQLVPLLVGRMSPDDYAQAAKAIVPYIDEDTLLVASSDFTHFGPRYGFVPFRDHVPDQLRELAEGAAAPILKCDFDGFLDHVARTQDTICGRGPIALLLRVLSMRGGAAGIRAGFDTSGRLTNDWSNSVSYQSIVFVPRPHKLGRKSRATLLKLARAAVTAYLTGTEPPKVDERELPEPLRADGACFVTLENQGRLRGCIGNMVADRPLYQSVLRDAVLACQDRRFVYNPVTAEELDQLHIEISYLTPMTRIEAPEEIVVGRDGLLIAFGPRRGVLLPQVAARYGWTRDEFLAQTCRKAGLPLDAWKQPGAQLYSFMADVFGEP